MAPRPKMDQELVNINDKITQMAQHVQRDILRAIDAIKDKDTDLARSIIDNGDMLDDLEDEINEDCFTFLATQAPIASDLRYCVSVMKMIRDLERMGDHCEDLSKYALRLEAEDYADQLVDIPRMADFASQMVNNAIAAFLDRDLRLARKVWKSDEEVDELFRDIYEHEMEEAEKNGNVSVCISLAFIAAHLERIADYATNICEEAVFFMEGEYSLA